MHFRLQSPIIKPQWAIYLKRTISCQVWVGLGHDIIEKACIETEWLKNLLADLSISAYFSTLVSIRCDCHVVIAKEKSKIYNGKSIHSFGTYYYKSNQLLEYGVVNLDFLQSELNLVDL